MNSEEQGLDRAKALEAALVAAREAAEALRLRFRRKIGEPALNSWTKDGGGLVTEADMASDQAIAQVLKVHNVPGAILSEESHTPASDDGLTWLVDPLCGTVPFSTGLAHWGVSIALRQGENLELGVLTLPAQQDQLTVVRGRGVSRNGRIWTSSPPGVSLSEVTVALEIDGGAEWKRALAGSLDWVGSVGQINSFSSAAFPVAQICLGRLAAAVFYRITPVHLAAGALIAAELGIVATDASGAPLNWSQDGEYPVVVIGWPEVHGQIIEAMSGK